MNIFKLVGQIVIEKDDAVAAINDTTDTAKNAESKLESSFAKFGTFAANAGKAIAAGLAVGTAAIGTLLKESLKISGEVEQGLGGAEAVYGKFAGKIVEKSKTAYSAMGLSMADYLATANKMGSLFVGTGAEIESAYDMTTNAMQRAADVAAIMGIDINWAMESVAGMAKGNFTMMDNLGVAMNETTLKAYALEKGITESWDEMEQGQKIGIAYQMFMERTAYAMGQYTKENDTYAGSISTMKAAWQNLLSGEVDAEELMPSIENGIRVIADRIAKLAPVLADGISTLIDALAPHIGPILDKLVPVFTDFALKIADTLIDHLLDKVSEWLSGGKKSDAEINTTAFANLVKDKSADKVIQDATNALKYSEDFNKGLEFAKGQVEAKVVQLTVEGSAGEAKKLREWWEKIQDELNFTAPLNLAPYGKPMNLPGANATTDEIMKWFATVDPELMKEFGIEYPDSTATNLEILEWWAGVRPKLVLAYSLVPGDDGGTGKKNGRVNGSFATGLDFVPRDNFIASLHKGEAVLTAKENSEYRQMKNGGDVGAAIAQLTDTINELQEGFQTNMNLYVNKKHVASALSRDMGRSIGNREYTLVRGMGG
jgi:hypothetical protein